jgi:hypothetical protein
VKQTRNLEDVCIGEHGPQMCNEILNHKYCMINPVNNTVRCAYRSPFGDCNGMYPCLYETEIEQYSREINLLEFDDI